MYLQCKCGKVLDLDKEFEYNSAAEYRGKKLFCLLRPGFTTIECGKCKLEWAVEISTITRKEVLITKGPFKGKKLQIPER
jgi:hypothetical protein